MAATRAQAQGGKGRRKGAKQTNAMHFEIGDLTVLRRTFGSKWRLAWRFLKCFRIGVLAWCVYTLANLMSLVLLSLGMCRCQNGTPAEHCAYAKRTSCIACDFGYDLGRPGSNRNEGGEGKVSDLTCLEGPQPPLVPEKPIQAPERSVDQNNQKTDELQRLMREGSASDANSAGPQPPQGPEKPIQAPERSVDQNNQKTDELQRLMREGIASDANSAGLARSTKIVRGEGVKDNECIDEFDDAFDQPIGWVDFQTLCISEPAFAKRAGACFGKSPKANVLDISSKHISLVPERLVMSCIEQFLRGYGETQALKTLESLDTSGNAIWLGDTRLVEFICSRLPRLSKLNVGNNKLEADTASRILSQLGSLESIDMSGNNLGIGPDRRTLGHTLSRLPRLSKLNLARNSLNLEDAEEILSPLVSLESLDLSENLLSIGNPQALGYTMSRLTRLSNLNLGKNGLNEETIDKILSPLEHLESLNLFENFLGLHDVRLVGNTLSKLPRVSTINLGKNKLDDKQIGDMFCPRSPLLTLRRLLLPDNVIREIAGFGASLVNTMPAIEELNLSSNTITGQSVVEFIGALRTNSRLLVLDLSENCISPDMAVNISAAAQRLPMLRTSGLGNQRNVTKYLCPGMK